MSSDDKSFCDSCLKYLRIFAKNTPWVHLEITSFLKPRSLEALPDPTQLLMKVRRDFSVVTSDPDRHCKMCGCGG